MIRSFLNGSWALDDSDPTPHDPLITPSRSWPAGWPGVPADGLNSTRPMSRWRP